MKILPFAMYIKELAEEAMCRDCEYFLVFDRVSYDHQTLKNGGHVYAYANCVSCQEETEIKINVDPIEEELIDEEPNTNENIRKTVFFTSVKRKNKRKCDN